jgi:ribosomal protein S18 acetylase RimI-like enzyme
MIDAADGRGPLVTPEDIDLHQRELGLRWARVQGGFVLDRPDELLTIVGEPVAWVNGVRSARLRPEDVEARVDEAIGLFREHGVPALWWVGPTSGPHDLGATLERRGFRRTEELPWFAAHIDDVADEEVTAELEFHRVDSPERQEQWLAAITAGFGMGERETRVMLRLAEATGFGDEGGWLRFVGLVQGRPVTSSGVMLANGLAGVYNVSTAPEHRRRGLADGMVRLALRRARELGYDTAVLSAAPGASGLYERMGFRRVSSVTEYAWDG